MYGSKQVMHVAGDESARRRLILWIWIAVTIVAVAVSLFWFVAGYPTVIHDSWGYYHLANVLRTRGFSRWPAEYRTYAYPFFAAAVTGFQKVPAEEFRLLVYFAQLIAYLVASGLLARRLARILNSPSTAPVAYALAALNPVLLLHTTEPLTDLLSAVLVLLALAYAWRIPDPGPRRTAGDAFLSFLWVGASAVIRPANVAVVAALVAVWGLRALRWRDVRWSSFAAAFAGLVPPFVPQMVLNHQTSGSWSPMITGKLYRMQVGWGMGALKYATLVMPDRSPFLMYPNPFYKGDPSPLAFLRNHPIEYATTLLLHGFGLIDQNLPFTYVTDLTPLYRRPLAIANFFVFYLAAAGLILGVARMVRRRSLDETAFVVMSTALVAGAYIALYLPVEVEARFGLVLAALTTPLIVAGLASLFEQGRARGRVWGFLLAGAPLAIGAAMWLSAWIERHRTNPVIDSPANVSTMNPPRRGARDAKP